MRRMICGMLLALAGCFLAGGCDKLDDGDDGIVSEVLLGKWSFSYTLKDTDEQGPDLFKYVSFNGDGTCSLVYTDTEILNGTWQATSAMIRIVADFIGEEQIMLWRIMSLSSKQIVAEYDFDINAQSYTIIVTLDKQ